MITLFRIFKYGLQNFLRNAGVSFSTIGVMILSLIVFEGLLLFNVVSNGAIKSIENKVDITVYFQNNVSEDTILGIKKSLEGINEVQYVNYVSKDEALVRFKAEHKDNEAISQTLEVLGYNPLLPSLNIKAKDIRNYGSITNYLKEFNEKGLIYKIDYTQNEVVINRLISLTDTIKTGGLILNIFLAFLAATVTFNTIRLAIFSNREEIEIMRLVGASNKFVRGPYIVEGIIYSFLASLVSFVLMIPFINFVSPYINNFISEVNLSNYLSENFLSLFGYQFLFAMFLGVFSSILATRKYLKI
jgi:cell division transport system permease protein